MKNAGRIFTLCWLVLIALLSAALTPMSTHLGIYKSSAKDALVSSLTPTLSALAVRQARNVLPDYSWIDIDSDASPDVENYIKESVMTALTDEKVQSLGRDGNLAWVIEAGDSEYSHFWKEEYNSTPGLLDITFSSDGTSVSSSANRAASVALFQDSSILVNPALVSPERLNSSAANSFQYRLRLPEDFSIRFYVPSAISPNGEYVAELIRSQDEQSMRLLTLAAGLVLFLFAMLCKSSAEQSSTLLARFIKLRAAFAWLLLGLSMPLLYELTEWVCNQCSSGTLTLTMRSLGLASWLAPVGAYGCVWAFWCALLFVISLTFLYIKYIFSVGIGYYAAHHTLLASAWNKSHALLVDSTMNGRRSRSRLLRIWAGILFFVAVFLALVFVIFESTGPAAAFGLLIAGTIFFLLLLWRLYDGMEKDYSCVLQAADELARGNFTDVQPEKTGQFQELYDDLEKIRQSYQQALEDGLSSQRTKSQLISNVSHDLKTPVAGIKSYSELITMSDNIDDIKKYAARLENYSSRLNSLIEDLFDVAKANSGDIVLEPALLDFAELVRQVCYEWQEELAARHLRLQMTLPQNAMIWLDPEKSMRIIDNLLGNVCKYALEQTRVFVEMECKDGKCVCIMKNVSRTPLDFKPEDIVERFVRGESSRHEAGSGLGLAIVKSFAEVQNGSFEVQTDGDVFKAVLVFSLANHGQGANQENNPANSPADSLANAPDENDKTDTLS